MKVTSVYFVNKAQKNKVGLKGNKMVGFSPILLTECSISAWSDNSFVSGEEQIFFQESKQITGNQETQKLF